MRAVGGGATGAGQLDEVWSGELNMATGKGHAAEAGSQRGGKHVHLLHKIQECGIQKLIAMQRKKALPVLLLVVTDGV